MNDKAAECATHMVLTLTMRNADPSDKSPYRTFCPLCIIGEVESLKTKLSELGLRTDNHNASRKSEIEYLRADVDRIDRINTGVLLGLADVLAADLADLADLKELTNRRIAPILEQIEKFRIELSELGLRTDNHNASRKSEIEYLRADVDRIDRINTGVLLGLADVLKMGPARELRLIGAKLVSRVADWLGGAK